MNTDHDGSMSTLHANSPREALSRIESMITMGGYSPPSRTIREMIVGSVDVLVQAARLRDGPRKNQLRRCRPNVPMILFFLPVLFIVILGPAAIRVMATQELQRVEAPAKR